MTSSSHPSEAAVSSLNNDGSRHERPRPLTRTECPGPLSKEWIARDKR